jgi:hypothetical protein
MPKRSTGGSGRRRIPIRGNWPSRAKAEGGRTLHGATRRVAQRSNKATAGGGRRPLRPGGRPGLLPPERGRGWETNGRCGAHARPSRVTGQRARAGRAGLATCRGPHGHVWRSCAALAPQGGKRRARKGRTGPYRAALCCAVLPACCAALRCVLLLLLLPIQLPRASSRTSSLASHGRCGRHVAAATAAR